MPDHLQYYDEQAQRPKWDLLVVVVPPSVQKMIHMPVLTLGSTSYLRQTPLMLLMFAQLGKGFYYGNID